MLDHDLDTIVHFDLACDPSTWLPRCVIDQGTSHLVDDVAGLSVL